MKRLALTAAFALTTGMFVNAQQSSQQTPPPAQTPPAQAAPEEKSKTDAKAAPTVAGKWNVSVQSEQGTMMSVLDLKVEGKKVNGTLSSQMGDAPVAGEFADGKLTFSMAFEGGGGSMQLNFSGAIKDDGTIAGTMDVGGMQIPWKAERIKEK